MVESIRFSKKQVIIENQFFFLDLVLIILNSLDGRVVRVSAFVAVDSGFIYSQLLCLTFSIEKTVWKTSQQVYFWCNWERHFTGFPNLGVVDRWPVTSKRARYSAWVAFL